MITTLRCSACRATVAIDLADDRLDPVEAHRCASKVPPPFVLSRARVRREIPHAPPLGDLDWLKCPTCAMVLRREWGPRGAEIPFHLRDDLDPESNASYVTCESVGAPA